MSKKFSDFCLVAVAFALVGTTAFAGDISGGTTGGGGNVQPADQVSEAYLIRAIQTSKPVVAAWLSNASQYYDNLKRLNLCGDPGQNCAIDAKLFDSKPNVFEILQKTEVETKLNQPCLDFNQKPNDGSMFGQKSGSVCISVSNIKQKLRSDNYESQIAALLLHEVSHLLGSTEDEAVHLQWQMLQMALAYIPVQTVEVEQLIAENSLVQFSNVLSLWAEAVQRNTSFDGECSMTDKVLSQVEDLQEKLRDPNFNFSFLNPENQKMFYGDLVKLRVTWNYICGQDQKADPAQRKMASDIYKFYFKDKTQMTVVEYGGGWSDEASPTVMLNRITDKSILNSEATDIVNIFRDISNWYSNSFLRGYFGTYSTQS